MGGGLVVLTRSPSLDLEHCVDDEHDGGDHAEELQDKEQCLLVDLGMTFTYRT